MKMIKKKNFICPIKVVVSHIYQCKVHNFIFLNKQIPVWLVL